MNWQCRECILNTEISPHRKRILRMTFDCMTKHDDDIIVYIYMEFIPCLVSSLHFVLSFVLRANERIGLFQAFGRVGKILTVESSLLHFFFRNCYGLVSLYFEFNQKNRKTMCFFMISLFTSKSSVCLHVMSAKCRLVYILRIFITSRRKAQKR